jgi:hypothetical protein
MLPLNSASPAAKDRMLFISMLFLDASEKEVL